MVALVIRMPVAPGESIGPLPTKIVMPLPVKLPLLSKEKLPLICSTPPKSMETSLSVSSTKAAVVDVAQPAWTSNSLAADAGSSA